jgi:hypothetical protein
MRGGKPIAETYFVRIGYLLAMVVRKYPEKKDGATRRCGNTKELRESPEVNTKRGWVPDWHQRSGEAVGVIRLKRANRESVAGGKTYRTRSRNCSGMNAILPEHVWRIGSM